jgi:uncharacterized protein YbjT (DUF2867 family)
MSPQSKTYVSKVALVGATGTLGSNILSALLAQETPQFQITLVTRPDSITSTTHPDITENPRITVKAGSYDDHDFLVSALAGQDALVIALGWAVCHELQPLIIRAACEAKVAYILPCEFGSDTSNPRLVAAIPMQAHKVEARRLVEELGGSWIGVTTNSWYDWSLAGGWFGIDIKARKATFWAAEEGEVKTYLSTLRTAGLAVARVLSLPLTAERKNPNVPQLGQQRSLPSFANKMVYVANFRVSQRDILDAVQRATQTTDQDWAITSVPVGEYIKQGFAKLAQGEMVGVMNIIYGNLFVKGVADGYFPGGAEGLEEADLDNAVLRLQDCEDLDAVTKRVVREVMED